MEENSGPEAGQQGDSNLESSQQVRVWDIWIRLFHWLLALSVLFMLVSGTTGWQFFEWHRTVGEFVLILLVFRLLWGILGSSNARLIALFTNPFKAFAHLRELLVSGRSMPERGHNAAGGWAVLVILGVIAFQATSGLFIADEDEILEGAFYGVLSSDLSYQLLQLHYIFATVIKVVVGVHVLMIMLYAVRASHNLLKPMITGRMNWPDFVAVPEVIFRNGWVGFAIAIVTGVAIGHLLSWW